MTKKPFTEPNIRLDKLVHGGQCLATATDGRKLFVWGGLPGELVDVRILKKKKDYLEGVVEIVHEPSPDRVAPEEPLSYLSTSPWQIMSIDAETKAKDLILKESFDREGIKLSWGDFVSPDDDTGYRNKMEFGFWGDENGLHLAHYVRGTHGKQMVTGSILAQSEINGAATSIVKSLNGFMLRAGDLKTIMLRCSRGGEVVAALFVKEKLDFSNFELPTGLKGMDIYYSNPKSPASVPTKKLYSFGDITLTDIIQGKNIMYDVLSFFQVNLSVFERALQKIEELLKDMSKVDFYSGVGTIGIPLQADVLVESDNHNIAMAKENVGSLQIQVVHASSESALDYITDTHALIIDPPRAGLHRAVIDQILEVKPPLIAYLSCNPSTQARDIAFLLKDYKIISAQGFNFFPRTPHIESLIILTLT